MRNLMPNKSLQATATAPSVLTGHENSIIIVPLPARLTVAVPELWTLGVMTTILNRKWHGIAALFWFLIGLIVTDLMGRYWANHFVVGFLIWLCLGWLSPVLLLAISGLRSGTMANRVCAVLALVAFVILVWMTMLAPLFFSPARL